MCINLEKSNIFLCRRRLTISKGCDQSKSVICVHVLESSFVPAIMGYASSLYLRMCDLPSNVAVHQSCCDPRFLYFYYIGWNFIVIKVGALWCIWCWWALVDFIYSLHDQLWISQGIKSISNNSDITIHVIELQFSLWRHQQSIVTSSAKRKLSKWDTETMCKDRSF